MRVEEGVKWKYLVIEKNKALRKRKGLKGLITGENKTKGHRKAKGKPYLEHIGRVGYKNKRKGQKRNDC